MTDNNTTHSSSLPLEVTLFTMGGTIDGADSDTGRIRIESDAACWLKQEPGVSATVHGICNKDSREVTNEDRAALIAAIRNSESDLILVTHGTFTICQTGRELKAAAADSDKTVLLVGAWVPFNERDSDAPTQMEFAVLMLREARHGIRVAMDGQLFDPDVTEKQLVDGKYRFSHRA